MSFGAETFTFETASKEQARARLAVLGPAGAGKTMTSLRIATVFAGEGGRIGVIDTEHGSASKYADLFHFETLRLTAPFDPRRYVAAIKAGEKAGFDVLVIDSLSHEWSGKGGCLEMVDNAARAMRKPDGHAAWREVTPHHNALLEAILQSSCHIVATFRSKMEYVRSEDGGKQRIERVGMAPVTREGAEYEFDIILDMLPADRGRVAAGTIVKSRAGSFLPQGTFVEEPGEELGLAIKRWLDDGAEVPLPARPAPPDGVTLDDIAEALKAVPTKDQKAALMRKHHVGITATREPDLSEATDLVGLAASLGLPRAAADAPAGDILDELSAGTAA